MTRLLGFCAVTTLILMLLMLATRVVGERLYRQPELLAGLGTCSTPCWNGIVLGESNISEAALILRARGFARTGSDGPVIFYRSGSRDCRVMVTYVQYEVTNLRFSGCGAILIGDMALALGLPSGVITTGSAGDWLRWRGNLLDAGVSSWTSPRVPVSSVGLNAPTGDISTGTPWRGFVPFWRYCQLERVLYYCPGAALNAPP